MAESYSVAKQPLSLDEIAKYHEDAVASFRFYFNEISTYSVERFFGYTLVERTNELKKRIDETALRSILIILASLEVGFRTNYEFRRKRRFKDGLSKAFREIHKERAKKVRLDEDIFEAWRNHIAESKGRIGDLRSAFNVRNWLAHGRYGERKPSASFDFDYYYDLAVVVNKEFFADGSVSP